MPGGGEGVEFVLRVSNIARVKMKGDFGSDDTGMRSLHDCCYLHCRYDQNFLCQTRLLLLKQHSVQNTTDDANHVSLRNTHVGCIGWVEHPARALCVQVLLYSADVRAYVDHIQHMVGYDKVCTAV